MAIEPTGVSIIIDDAAIVGALGRLEQAKLQPALDAIGAHLLATTQRRFEKETGPDGQKWKRLSPRTAAKRIGKRERGYDNILRVSNRLSNSLVYDASETEARVGTNVVYAAIHQLGGKIEMPARRQTIFQRYDAKKDVLDQRFVKPSRSTFARDVDVKAHTITMPARPYLGVDDADRKAILEIVSDFANGEIAP